MNKYEELLDTAASEDVTVIENYDLSGTRLKGLYCDGTVALSNELSTDAERYCVLAEEIGHHFTTSGNIIDINDINSRKQEQIARVWAYRHAFDLSDLIGAYKAGCRNRYEIAEHIGITEEFLSDALLSYSHHYGPFTTFDRYIIYFEPLGIIEFLQ